MNPNAPSFPALAFRRDVGRDPVPGRERLALFFNEEDFATSTMWGIQRGERLGMELADSDGRCWRVLSVVDLGVVGSFWERVLRFLLRQSLHGLDQQLVEIEPLTLDQLKARACASIQANPDDWRDDEAIAGEVDPPREEQDLLDELKAKAMAAQTLHQLMNALYNEEFPD